MDAGRIGQGRAGQGRAGQGNAGEIPPLRSLPRMPCRAFSPGAICVRSSGVTSAVILRGTLRHLPLLPRPLPPRPSPGTRSCSLPPTPPPLRPVLKNVAFCSDHTAGGALPYKSPQTFRNYVIQSTIWRGNIAINTGAVCKPLNRWRRNQSGQLRRVFASVPRCRVALLRLAASCPSHYYACARLSLSLL